MRRSSSDNTLRCSFCQKGPANDGKLIASPAGDPRAYICDECITVCASIIEDDRLEARQADAGQVQETPHQGSRDPLLDHPRASELMAAIENWVREESLGNDGIAALRNVYRIASRMLQSR